MKEKFNDEIIFFVPELALESKFAIRFLMAKIKAPPVINKLVGRAKLEERGARM